MPGIIMLSSLVVASIAIRDLSLPFPRPTPAQAVAQLSEAVERQAGEPNDVRFHHVAFGISAAKLRSYIMRRVARLPRVTDDRCVRRTIRVARRV